MLISHWIHSLNLYIYFFIFFYNQMMIHDCYVRWNWEISRRDFQNHQFIAMFNANREFLDLDFAYSSAPSTRSLIFFRIIAIIVISFPPFINVFCMKKMKKKKKRVVGEKLCVVWKVSINLYMTFAIIWKMWYIYRTDIGWYIMNLDHAIIFCSRETWQFEIYLYMNLVTKTTF